MARPRVFVSSTYYDLKHLRSALEGFIESLGFEPVLSEKGSIAYAPDIALDASCYREIQQADIMVLIVGGRYGSEVSDSERVKSKKGDDFYTRYDSITRQEFKTAAESNVPLYVLIERAVYAEYQTFKKNRSSTKVKYAHVDSANIFMMVEEVLALPKNNPLFSFDRYHEIEEWLRDQWAGLFQELLRTRSSQQQLTSLSLQVNQLTESNTTLRRYLESLMTTVAPKDSKEIINEETRRLKDMRLQSLILQAFNDFGVSNDFVVAAVRDANSLEEFVEMMNSSSQLSVQLGTNAIEYRSGRQGGAVAFEGVNAMRIALGLPPFSVAVSPGNRTAPLAPRGKPSNS